MGTLNLRDRVTIDAISGSQTSAEARMHQHHCLYCQNQTLQLQGAEALSQGQRHSKLMRLGITFGLASLYSGFELLMGHRSHSLSLLADAGHMVSDSFGLAIALGAAWWTQQAQRPSHPPSAPSPQRSPEHNQRFEVYAALVNSLGLMVMAGWIAWETVMRFQAGSPEVYSLPMMLAALVGLLVHGINAALLYGHSRADLNLRGAFLHVLADAMGSVGILLAAIAVAQFQWLWADGVIGLFVSGLIALSAIPLVVDSLKALIRPETALNPQTTAKAPSLPWDIAEFSQHILLAPEILAPEILASEILASETVSEDSSP